MARPLRRFALAALSVLALNGCSPPEIHMRVVRAGGTVTVHLHQNWGWFGSRRQTPEICTIHLYGAENALAWGAIVPGGGDCRELASFEVGRSPAGFEEIAPLLPNTRGSFRLSVSGLGSGEAQVDLQDSD